MKKIISKCGCATATRQMRIIVPSISSHRNRFPPSRSTMILHGRRCWSRTARKTMPTAAAATTTIATRSYSNYGCNVGAESIVNNGSRWQHTAAAEGATSAAVAAALVAVAATMNTPPLSSPQLAQCESETSDFVADDPYENLPEEDPDTTCFLCRTHRQGPCRTPWRKFEYCVKDRQKAEAEEQQKKQQQQDNPTTTTTTSHDNDDDDPARFCDRYVVPFERCWMEHVGLYLLIALEVNREEHVVVLDRMYPEESRELFPLPINDGNNENENKNNGPNSNYYANPVDDVAWDWTAWNAYHEKQQQLQQQPEQQADEDVINNRGVGANDGGGVGVFATATTTGNNNNNNHNFNNNNNNANAVAAASIIRERLAIESAANARRKMTAAALMRQVTTVKMEEDTATINGSSSSSSNDPNNSEPPPQNPFAPPTFTTTTIATKATASPEEEIEESSPKTETYLPKTRRKASPLWKHFDAAGVKPIFVSGSAAVPVDVVLPFADDESCSTSAETTANSSSSSFRAYQLRVAYAVDQNDNVLGFSEYYPPAVPEPPTTAAKDSNDETEITSKEKEAKKPVNGFSSGSNGGNSETTETTSNATNIELQQPPPALLPQRHKILLTLLPGLTESVRVVALYVEVESEENQHSKISISRSNSNHNGGRLDSIMYQTPRLAVPVPRGVPK